jgi:hypothetical protein
MIEGFGSDRRCSSERPRRLHAVQTDGNGRNGTQRAEQLEGVGSGWTCSNSEGVQLEYFETRIPWNKFTFNMGPLDQQQV